MHNLPNKAQLDKLFFTQNEYYTAEDIQTIRQLANCFNYDPVSMALHVKPQIEEGAKEALQAQIAQFDKDSLEAEFLRHNEDIIQREAAKILEDLIVEEFAGIVDLFHQGINDEQVAAIANQCVDLESELPTATPVLVM